MKKEIILSGLRPTGKLHIGNYLGAIQNFVELQKSHECYFFIADLHSLTEDYDPKKKPQEIINFAADLLASGIDPKKCTLFVQSHIPQHSELAILLSNIIPISYLFRMTQYKDKSADISKKNLNAGLLYYPVLMASDILIYKPSAIPVGHDQTQHVELARDAAKFFNNAYGKVFPEPKAIYTKTPKIMSLLSPEKKMSKSLGDNHSIYIDDTPSVITKKISRAVTDTGDGKSTGAKNLLYLAEIFCTRGVYNKFVSDQKNKKLQYSELKNSISQSIAKYFADFRAKKEKLLKHPEKIKKILMDGDAKAKKIAQITLEEVKKKIGISL